MLVSQKQLDANRRNAQLSAGPQTPEGKTAASRNALDHGFYAFTALLPGEPPEPYESYCRSLNDSLLPLGQLEQDLVDEMCVCKWKLRRLSRAEIYAFDGARTDLLQRRLPAEREIPLDPAELANWAYSYGPAFKGLDRLSSHHSRLNRDYFKALRELRLIQNDRRRREAQSAPDPDPAPDPQPQTPPEPEPLAPGPQLTPDPSQTPSDNHQPPSPACYSKIPNRTCRRKGHCPEFASRWASRTSPSSWITHAAKPRSAKPSSNSASITSNTPSKAPRPFPDSSTSIPNAPCSPPAAVIRITENSTAASKRRCGF